VDKLGGQFVVGTYMPLLEDMKKYSTILILLSLIFSIVTIIFVIISALLVYSLLMISMEDKIFQNAVMRLLGMSKYSISSMVFLQAIFFVLPSITVALISIVPLLYEFTHALKLDGAPIVPTASAILYALTLGILIPSISAIIPIKKALSQSIVDTLGGCESKEK
jgi:ABC-type antimicrobial peptide transport system permease subunit